jgi:predicted negative regulator of RcsB-dependent stress response
VPDKSHPHGRVDTLDEIESIFDRLANWVAAHAVAVGVGVALLLIAGGSFEFLRSRAERRALEASDAFDQVQSAYLLAMGAEPGAVELPELANPEAAARIRTEYLEKFRGVAQAHPGTLVAALASMEIAELLEAGGDAAGALEALRQALREMPDNPRLAGLLHQRIAQRLEDDDKLAEAAAEHEAAGQLAGFPLRYIALADAARCYAQAGQPERALPLLERVEAEGKNPLPPHLRILLRELRAAQAS